MNSVDVVHERCLLSIIQVRTPGGVVGMFPYRRADLSQVRSPTLRDCFPRFRMCGRAPIRRVYDIQADSQNIPMLPVPYDPDA